MSKEPYRAVTGAILLEFLSCQLGPKHIAWADESPVSPSSQDLPEGSSSVIESLSLPTRKLSALRQALSKLGSVSAPEAEAVPSAPTTLLRLMVVRP